MIDVRCNSIYERIPGVVLLTGQPSSLGQAHSSAYRRSLAVSSTTIVYFVYVVILGCVWDSNLIGCFRFINVS